MSVCLSSPTSRDLEVMRLPYSRVPASPLGRGGRVTKPDLPPGLLLPLLIAPHQPGGDTWNYPRGSLYTATPAGAGAIGDMVPVPPPPPPPPPPQVLPQKPRRLKLKVTPGGPDIRGFDPPPMRTDHRWHFHTSGPGAFTLAGTVDAFRGHTGSKRMELGVVCLGGY